MMRLAFVCILALLLAACAAPASGPVTWIDRPLDGDQYGLEVITLQAHASDASGVGKFEFFIDNNLLSSPAGAGGRFSQATVEWVPPAPGTYVVRARSVNAAGATGPEARAVIVVGNRTPTPAPGITAAPTVVTVTPSPTVVTVTPSPTVVTVTPSPTAACAGAPFFSSFAANPTTITAGTSSQLIWGPIANADSAIINSGTLGATPSGGSLRVQPTATTTYVLSATGCGGTVVTSVTISVQPPAPVCPGPPVIVSFDANPSTITAGQSATLSWGAVTNATSASIDPGIGGVGTPGSTSVSPGSTTTYVLSASGCGGTAQRQVTVTVEPAELPLEQITAIIMPRVLPSRTPPLQ